MMGLSVGEVFADLGLDTKGFDMKLAGMDAKLHRGLGGALKGLVPIAATAMAAVGAAVAATVVKGVKEFAEFDKSMREVFTLLPGISQSAMGAMSQDVKDFAVEFGVLPEKVVPALYQSLSAGVPKDNVFAFMETAQKAAKGGVAELETAVDGLSSVTNAYGRDVISATKASDLMFTAVKLGKTTFEELSASLFNVIPTAAALGVEFDDVTAAIAAMTAQGTPTSVATTQLRQMFVELSKAGSDTAEVFEKVAGKSFKAFVREGGNTAEALMMLEEYAHDAGLGVNDLFGSVEAGNAALALTGKGAKTFKKNLDAMGDSAGATQAAYEQMDGGISAAWDRIRSTLSVALINVGDAVAPVVEDLSKDFTEGLTGLAAWIKNNKGTIEGFFRGIAELAGDAAKAVGWVIEAHEEMFAGISAFDAQTRASGFVTHTFDDIDTMSINEKADAIGKLRGDISELQSLSAHPSMPADLKGKMASDLKRVRAEILAILRAGPVELIDKDGVANLSQAKVQIDQIGKDIKTVDALEAEGIIDKSTANELRKMLKEARKELRSGLSEIERMAGSQGGKAGKMTVDEMFSGIISGKPKVRGAGRQLVEGAGDGAAQGVAASNTWGLGVNFGAAFASGISSTANSAYRSAAAVAQAAAAGIKTTGQLKSPSKLMRGLGQFYGKGFELGLRDMVGDVTRAARSVGQAGLGVGVPGGLGAGGPGAGAGPTIVVEHYGDTYGIDDAAAFYGAAYDAASEAAGVSRARM